MRAGTKRISTKLNDTQTASAMLDLAQSRGWDTVRVKGTADFQREAWVQAQVRGMKAEGYRPTATDQQELTRRKTAVAPIQAPAFKAAESTAPAGAAAAKDTAKVTNSVTASAPTEKAEAAPAKAAAAPQPRRAAAARRSAAASPASAATPAAPNKVKMVPIERNKAVWGAVEAAGQQARGADPAAARATAGERPTAASVT